MAKQAPGWGVRARRVAGSRWWLVVIAGLLALDFAALPRRSLALSQVKWEILGRTGLRSAAVQMGWTMPGRPRLGADGLEWDWSWEPGVGAREASPWAEVRVYVLFPRRTGVYHLTRETRRVMVLGASLNPAEIADLHAVLIEELQTEPEVSREEMLPVIETLRRDGTWTRELPDGYWRDLIAAEMAVAWVGLLVLHILYWFLSGRCRAWRRWVRMRWRRWLPSMRAQSRKHATR